MIIALPPGTVSRMVDAALQDAENLGRRFDEDHVGLVLPEPIAVQRPGIAISVFPTAGSRPGGANLVFPIRTLIRVSVPDGSLDYDIPAAVRGMHPSGPHGALGSLNEGTAMPWDQRRTLDSKYMSLLDAVCPAVAEGDHPGALQAAMKEVFTTLMEPALSPTYRLIAPLFMQWLGPT